MAAMKKVASVAEYIDNHGQWSEELRKLRKILTSSGLEETVKWGGPCYTHQGKNVVGLGGFKEWAALWFHQGALLSDPDGVLINAQEGKTKALRQWRFRKGDPIPVRKIKAYVKEAYALAELGEGVRPARKKALAMPAELTAALAKKAKTKRAFESLRPGQQREYAEYIAGAKREATRERRIAKIVPMIESGAGLNDRYRNC